MKNNMIMYGFVLALTGQYEIVTRDKIVANGELSLDGKQPTLFKQPVKYGQYRLEILDEKNGIASSYRFSAGWFHAQEAPDRPDILEFKIENKSKIILTSLIYLLKAPLQVN